MSKYRQIYTRADYDKLKDLQRKLHDLLPICDDAEACGVETAAWRGLIEETQRTLTEIESRFMSPIPKR